MFSGWRAARAWIIERLTRRRAWAAIAFIVIWNAVLGSVVVHQALNDDLPLAVVLPQMAIVLALVVGLSIWLLRHCKVPSN